MARALVVGLAVFAVVVCPLVAADGLNAKAWAATDLGSFEWPESSLPDIQARPNIGICFVGGGSRAYASSTGILRTLHDRGILREVRYMAGVSGGGWAVSALQFRERANTRQFLGDITDPGRLTLARLAEMPAEGTMLYPLPNMLSLSPYASLFLSPNAIQNALGYVAQGGTDNTLWSTTVTACFHESLGAENGIVSWDMDTVRDIQERNPSLLDATFITPKDNLPFPIVTGAAVGPVDMAPLAANTVSSAFTGVEFTPLYTGEVFVKDSAYLSLAGEQRTVSRGGIIEPFAYGGTITSSGLPVSADMPNAEGSVDVTAASQPLLWGDALGITSYVAGSLFATDGQVLQATGYALPTWVVVPSFGSTNVVNPSESTPTLLGDGAIVEPTGLLPLLRRRVHHAVVFNHPAVDPAFDGTLLSLFDGSNPGLVSDGWDVSHNQVFPSDRFSELVYTLQMKVESGEPAVHTMELVTVENSHWGIPAGHEVTVTFVHVATFSDFLDRLPQETQDEIADQGEGSTFENFPYYETIDQIQLTASQSNLLAHLTSHLVLQAEAQIRSGLGLHGPYQYGMGGMGHGMNHGMNH